MGDPDLFTALARLCRRWRHHRAQRLARLCDLGRPIDHETTQARQPK